MVDNSKPRGPASPLKRKRCLKCRTFVLLPRERFLCNSCNENNKTKVGTEVTEWGFSSSGRRIGGG